MSEDRLIKSMIEQGRIGREKKRKVEDFNHLDPDHGLTRLSGSREDKEARDIVASMMRNLGMEINVDMVGNMFGHLDGLEQKGGIMIGSHIDSVKNGGMFDGNLGVFGALEAVRRLNDEDFRNIRPIDVAVYTGEEGSAFNYLLLGSSALTGKLSVDDAYRMSNRKGEYLKTALERMGYRGNFIKDMSDVEYHLELHIEQGPVLESKGYDIGIVQNITGLTWMSGEVTGSQGHAGTAPMKMRKDALVATSEIIQYLNARASEIGSTTVGTIGEMHVEPNLPNVIPKKVLFKVDIRDVESEHLRQLESDMLARARDVEKRRGVRIAMATSFSHGATPMNQEVMAAVKKASDSLRLRNIGINSGAGHDSQNLAHHVKTGMIFVPSRGGISHAPLEWTDWGLVEKGVRVLTESIRALASRPVK